MLQLRDIPGKSRSAADHGPLEQRLRTHVLRMARRRHLWAQPRENHRVGRYIREAFQSFGLAADFDGPLRNVVALPRPGASPAVLVAAHYDSVAWSPGADDNASAVAVLLEVGRMSAALGLDVGCVAFNGEEENLAGSREFVATRVLGGFRPSLVHVLEMVGYTDRNPDSQSKPRALPIRLPRVGDFLGVLANGPSRLHLQQFHETVGELSTAPHVVTLQTRWGVEYLLGDLLRSDHVPFWKSGVPALLWTDTGNFRNPNYHRATDTADTLDYRFMTEVCLLLTACLKRRSA